MKMSTSFAALLDKPADEIEAPKPIPTGFYRVMNTKFEMGESAKKKTPYVQFEVSLISAEAEVDEDELEAAGGTEGKTLRQTFYLTPDSMFRVKEFAQNILGVETKGLSLGEVIQSSLQIPYIASVNHTPSPDGSRIYTEIGTMAKIED
jgi:hypothetical protein